MKQDKSKFVMNVVGASLAAAGILASGSAFAQIAGSKHDLGNATNTNNNRVTGGAGGLDSQICVFCHTPHVANTSAPGAPLWNKGLSSTTYTTYATGSMDQTQATTADIQGGASIACLSCHDGTQGMDNLINAPGSKGVTAGGADAGYTWSSGTAGSTVTAAGVLTSPVANLTNDLSNDHPIGIFYCANSNTMTDNATTNCRDADFRAPRRNTDLSWWVDVSGVGTAGLKEKTDMQLYARTGTLNRPRVECGSCHDPHAGGNATFLRTANTGSRVCLACHNK